jgi:lysophospholipase L1-like esterase
MKRIVLLLCIGLLVSFGPEQQIKWIALGDSITYLNDHLDEAGEYHHYRYPDFVDVGFNPDADEYPYPPRAVNMTYDGLHPSDEGNEMIARMLVKMLQKIKLF